MILLDVELELVGRGGIKTGTDRMRRWIDKMQRRESEFSRIQ